MARYLGIEITDGSVKGVVLRTAYRKIQIEAVHRIPREAGLDGVTRASAELVARVGGQVDGVYTALPGTEVSMRMIDLPRAVLKRGGRVVATELEGSLPFEIDDAVVDAQPVRQTPTDATLLAAAVRTERVRALVEALKAAGAEPREVGVGPVALGDLAAEVPELAAEGPIMMLHAYDTHADFAVLAGGVVQMARTLAAQTTPMARARGIKQTLGAYLAGGGTPPVVAYLFGEKAWENADVVADALGLPAEAIRAQLPLGPIEIAPTLSPHEPAYAPLALALALRGLGRTPRIDLRKGPLAVTGGTQVLRERAWLLAGCAAFVLVSWMFATFTRYNAVADERDRLRTALGRVTQEVFNERITNPQRARNLALGTGPDSDLDPLPGADAFDVIGVLSSRIPESIRHDILQLDISDEHVQLQGVVGTVAERDQIVEALRQYECFQNIQPGRIQRTGADNRQQYVLDIELRCPERQQTGNRRGGRGGAGGGENSNSGGSGGGTGSTGGGSGGGV